ncbi:hypothetical protein RRG08_056762, partial [Elysia crispata]
NVTNPKVFFSRNAH